MPTFVIEPNIARKKELIKLLGIKEMKAVGYSNNKEPWQESKPVSIEKYDVNGELIESYAFLEGTTEVRMTVSTDKQGKIIKTYSYDNMEFHKYDSNQRIIERKSFTEKGRIREWIHYDYDESYEGIEICREYSYRNKYLGKSVYKIDEQGNTLFEAFYNEHDEPVAKYTYQYDETSRLIRTIEWGVITRHSPEFSSVRYLGLHYLDNRYEYDENGNLAKKLRFNADETINWCKSEFYRYDGSNRRIEESGFNDDGKISWKLTFTYDVATNLVLQNYADANDVNLHSKAWLYNEMGLICELIFEDHGDNLKNRYVYSYEYY